MKFKTTKKAIKENAYAVLSVGYCDLQYLLQFQKPIAYSSGQYGWQCDYYQFGNLWLATGYDTPNSQNIEEPRYQEIRAIEAKARRIIETDHKTKEKKINKLLDSFIKKIKIK